MFEFLDLVDAGAEETVEVDQKADGFLNALEVLTCGEEEEGLRAVVGIYEVAGDCGGF